MQLQLLENQHSRRRWNRGRLRVFSREPDSAVVLRTNLPLTDLAKAHLAVDPVAHPAAYVELLVGLVGSGDPGRVQMATITDLAPLQDASEDQVRERPSFDEWSIIEVLGHLVDSEITAAYRYRAILSENEAVLPGYSQEKWVQALKYQQSSVQDLLDLFEPLRRSNISLWERSSPVERLRSGRHLERGIESFETLFKMQAGHDIIHLGQIFRLLSGQE